MWTRTADFLDIHDCYLAAVGRGVFLAQNFEQNCKYVLLVWDLGEAFKSGRKVDDLPAYSSVLLKRFLGQVVKRFGTKYGIRADQHQVLEKARDARNYLAHEVALPCLYPSGDPDLIMSELPGFKQNIEALAEGDNLVSCWSYMIQEKDFPPTQKRQGYVEEIVSYVLEPLESYLS